MARANVGEFDTILEGAFGERINTGTPGSMRVLPARAAKSGYYQYRKREQKIVNSLDAGIGREMGYQDTHAPLQRSSAIVRSQVIDRDAGSFFVSDKEAERYRSPSGMQELIAEADAELFSNALYIHSKEWYSVSQSLADKTSGFELDLASQAFPLSEWTSELIVEMLKTAQRKPNFIYLPSLAIAKLAQNTNVIGGAGIAGLGSTDTLARLGYATTDAVVSFFAAHGLELIEDSTVAQVEADGTTGFVWGDRVVLGYANAFNGLGFTAVEDGSMANILTVEPNRSSGRNTAGTFYNGSCSFALELADSACAFRSDISYE